MNQQTVLRYVCPKGDYEVSVQTDSIDYAWSNFQGRIHYRNLLVDEADRSNPDAYCHYQSSGSNIYLLDHTAPLDASQMHRPVVFETNKYHIKIKLHQIDPAYKPQVIHINKEVEKAFFDDHNDERTEWRFDGTIDFVNQPGLFVLKFAYKKQGRVHKEWVAFDVVSPKLDVRHDYKRILDDVNQEFEGIVFDYLSTTFQQLMRGKEKNLQVWMQVFEGVVDDYLRNIDRIIQSPHSKMHTTKQYAKADRVRHWLPAMEEAYAEVRAAGHLERHYFEEQVYDHTVNTYENRFVKHTLKSIGGTLAKVFDKLLAANSEVSDHYRESWRVYQDRLAKYQKHPFFKSVGPFEGMRHVGMVLQSRKGYQQVYKDWIKLRKGIDFYNGANSIGTMQIWEIYELWCFLKVKRMVRELMGFDPIRPNSYYGNLISEPQGNLLKEGADRKGEYTIEFAYPALDQVAPQYPEHLRPLLQAHAGGRVVLHYQHTYSRNEGDKDRIRTLTTEQRPDIVLNIHHHDTMLTYLYDAKYRVWSDKTLDKQMEQADLEEMDRIVAADNATLDASQRLHGADYPPSDAINQMHRYRDAIYYGMDKDDRPESKEIIGGYILFPGRGDDQSIAQRYFSRSIDTVNIGAFPLLPLKKAKNDQGQDLEGPQLWCHLEEILLRRESPMAHVQESVPQRGLRYVADAPETEPRQRVLCCRLVDQQLVDFAHGLYRMPLRPDPTGRLLPDMQMAAATRFVFYQMVGDEPQVDPLSQYERGLAEGPDRTSFVAIGEGQMALQFMLASATPTHTAQEWEHLISNYLHENPNESEFWM